MATALNETSGLMVLNRKSSAPNLSCYPEMRIYRFQKSAASFTRGVAIDRGLIVIVNESIFRLFPELSDLRSAANECIWQPHDGTPRRFTPKDHPRLLLALNGSPNTMPADDATGITAKTVGKLARR